MSGRIAVITLCSTPRLAHLRVQSAHLARSGVERIVVWIGDEAPPPLDAERVVRVPPGPHGLRLAAARNAGAAAARASGADLWIFLDADCVPGPALLGGYGAALARRPDAVLCGPVTYLPPGIDASDAAVLVSATAPHPARPAPSEGEIVIAPSEDHRLFWSLSFALAPATWDRIGGFDPGYEGYGGEDTDFGYAMRSAGVPLAWVGGAHAYHQHHPSQSPPWGHLDDILRNGERFADRWGEWPMTGWIDAFAERGAIAWNGHTWHRVKTAS